MRFAGLAGLASLMLAPTTSAVQAADSLFELSKDAVCSSVSFGQCINPRYIVTLKSLVDDLVVTGGKMNEGKCELKSESLPWKGAKDATLQLFGCEAVTQVDLVTSKGSISQKFEDAPAGSSD